MSGDLQLDPHGRREELERQIANLRVENQRLRNLLRVTDGVEPPVRNRRSRLPIQA